MTITSQKRLAVAGALVAVAVFVGANIQLFTAAFQSHPDCAVISDDRAPARNTC